jgi:flagellar basal body-associated protein FliL
MEQQESDKAAPAEKKKGSKARTIGMIIAAVLVLGAGAAGAVMGPRLFGGGASHAKPAEDHGDEASEEGHTDEEEAEAEPKPKSKSSAKDGDVHEITNLQPIIVDVAASDGPARHLKITLSVEHPEAFKEADFKLYVPRAREAAIVLLRSKNYEQLADPKNFDAVRKELNQAIVEAVGKKRAKRILISDFVTQ